MLNNFVLIAKGTLPQRGLNDTILIVNYNNACTKNGVNSKASDEKRSLVTPYFGGIFMIIFVRTIHCNKKFKLV